MPPFSPPPSLGHRLTRGLWEILQTLLLAGLMFAAGTSVAEARLVDGPSMLPTLHAGERLLVDKVSYLRAGDSASPLRALLPDLPEYPLGGPRRGDVVVLYPPTDPDTALVKRLIGLPGDSVLIRDGRVLRNGEPIDEPYIHFPARYTYPSSGRPLVVPEGHYFVLGDNRPNSNDSHLGWLVPAENLVGRAWVAFWPPSAWTLLTP